MKLFCVSAASCGYDEYDSFVIIAESEEQVKYLLDKKGLTDEDVNVENVVNLCILRFDKSQEPITIKEIKIEDFKKPTVICASYNAG